MLTRRAGKVSTAMVSGMVSAAHGAYLADDLGSYCSSEHESMLQKLREVGILPPDRRAPD